MIFVELFTFELQLTIGLMQRQKSEYIYLGSILYHSNQSTGV